MSCYRGGNDLTTGDGLGGPCSRRKNEADAHKTTTLTALEMAEMLARSHNLNRELQKELAKAHAELAAKERELAEARASRTARRRRDEQ